MTTTESQDILLYVPRSNMFTASLMELCLLMGLALPFFEGWQLTILVGSLSLILLGGGLGPFLIWKMSHKPILVINKDIKKRSFFSR